jgi:uncharacterized membrane protein YagU involved in acid resistance
MMRAILLGGLVAGTLDILDAVVFSYAGAGVPPVRVLQAVASGLQGRSAYQGGFATALLGLTLHFCIAITAAAVFVVASLLMPVLRRHAVTFGLLYGVAVYFTMYWIVLPFSAFRAGPFDWPSFANAILIHTLGVGLPIALITRRELGPRRSCDPAPWLAMLTGARNK